MLYCYYTVLYYYTVLSPVIPDTSLAVYRRIVEPEAQKVGVTAHIGGFMAGMLFLFFGVFPFVSPICYDCC